MTRAPYLSARLQGFGTTVFAEMSALAVATGAGRRQLFCASQVSPPVTVPPWVLSGASASTL